MANQKISQLPAATSTSGPDLYPLVQGGLNYSITFAILQSALATGITSSLSLFTSSSQGVVPASGGGTANFLRADGTWSTPSAGSGVSSLNSLTGAVAIVAGSNITITPSGSDLVIAASSSGSTPGGSSHSIQFNNGGSFGGFGSWDGTTFTDPGKLSVVGTTSLDNGAIVSSGNGSLTASNWNINTNGSVSFSGNNFIIDDLGNTTTTGYINSGIGQSTYSGSTSGEAVYSMPFQGASYKKFVVNMQNLIDAGGTITFPTAFSHQPYMYGDSAAVAIASVSPTALTLSSSAGISGNIFVEGY